MSPPGTLGGRLRALRRQRGLSQAELAGEDLSPSYVSLIEADRRTPTVAVLALLATRLGSTPDYLETGVEASQREETLIELAYAELALSSGEAAEAERRLRVLVSDDVVAGSPDLARRAWRALAGALEALGHLEQAIAAYERLLPEDEAADDGWFTVVIALCRCYREAGDLAHSIDLGERAVTRARQLGLAGTDAEIELAATLVAAYHERGDVTRARILAAQVVSRAEESGSPRARGAAYWNASLVASSQGHQREALELADRALALYGEEVQARSLARLRSAYAWLLLRQPEPEAEAALAQLDRATTTLADAGSEVDLAYCDIEAGRALVLLGRADEAKVRVDDGLLRLGPGVRLERAAGLVVRGRAQAALGDVEAASEAYRSAAGVLAAAASTREGAAVWCELAELFEAVGDAEGALSAYRAATALLGLPPTVRLPVTVNRI